MGSNRFRIDIPRYVELYLQGRPRLDDLITARIGGGEGARTVVTFDRQREERP
jgi:Zn-dependent alcohol dehydrogenase